jgi:hypothetical protein
MSQYRYLFGSPAAPRPPTSRQRCHTFILGAYPSAIYVRWMPPRVPPIAAVAIADEPEPFWDGHDEGDQVLRWCQSLHWKVGWGEVKLAGRLNGSSGAWLNGNVLAPLHLPRHAAWITDCIDVYHESKSVKSRLDSPQLRRLISRGKIPDRQLPPHPTEAQIVKCAQRERLSDELWECRPSRVITLGNAALRVFNTLLEQPTSLSKLSPGRSYGKSLSARTAHGLSVEWIPLAHPAAPVAYQDAHRRWKARPHPPA